MRDIPNKADNIGDTLPAPDFNAFKNENQNIVTGTYQTLDPEGGPDTDTDQLGKGIALYSSASDFYSDSGAANAYVLARSTTLQPVESYRDGLRASFIAGNTNTGASTVNISSIGVKNITLPDGTALSGGEIVAGKYVDIRYNLSNDRFHIILPVATLPRGYIDGLVLENNSGDSQHDIDINPGECRSDANNLDMTFSSVFTKQIDVNWAEGTGLGGFPSGLTLTADTCYHVFIIGKADGSAFDAGFDTSLTAANLLSDASGYSSYRRLGSVLVDGSSNILGFSQHGDEFLWDDPPMDTFTPSTSAVLRTLPIPLGVKVKALITVYTYSTAGPPAVYISPPDINDEVPDFQYTNPPGCTVLNFTNIVEYSSQAAYIYVRSNTSSQVRSRCNVSSGDEKIVTFGWIDLRGKNG